MQLISLTRGYEAMVDDDDYDRVSQYKWQILPAPHTIYAKRSHYPFGYKRAVTERLHRFIMNAPGGVEVDHIDRNGLNCQRYNLRFATRSEQSLNRAHYGPHKYKGVYPYDGKFVVKIRKDYRTLHFGTYDTEDEAVIVHAIEFKKLFL